MSRSTQRLNLLKDESNCRPLGWLTDPTAVAADSEEIAEAIVGLWVAFDLHLRPILGSAGVAALFWRCLHLTAATHPRFAELKEGTQPVMDLAGLGERLAQCDTATAAAAGSALLHAFDRLLASLIGTELSEQLLGTVWANALIIPVKEPLP